MRHPQKGAALIVVLSLLTISLMVGLSSMQSSMIDERLAGNYRLYTHAQQSAESIAAEMVTFAIDNDMQAGDDVVLRSCPSFSELQDISSSTSYCLTGERNVEGEMRNEEGAGAKISGVSCFLDVSAGMCGISYSSSYMLSRGAVFSSGSVLAESEIIAVEVEGGYKFDDSITGCESVDLRGGAGVEGGVVSGGDVDISGGVYPPDGIAAQGEVNYPSWWDGNGEYSDLTSDFFEGVPFPSCDPFDIVTKSQGFLSLPSSGDISVGGYPFVNSVITPDGLSTFDATESVQDDVELASATDMVLPDLPSFVDKQEGEYSVIKTGDFIQRNGSLTVSGGDVVLYVDGDLTLGAGGNEGLIIEPGSTLTVIVTGETNLNSSLQTSSAPLVTNDKPTFALYSLHEDSGDKAVPNKSGVVVDGSANVLANIYSPRSNVAVVGSGGIKGTVRGKNVRVVGAGSISNKDASTENVGGMEIKSWR